MDDCQGWNVRKVGAVDYYYYGYGSGSGSGYGYGYGCGYGLITGDGVLMAEA